MKIGFTDALRGPGDICYLLQQGLKKKTFTDARCIHLLMISSGLDSIPFLCDHLIRLFAACGCLIEANKVFYKIPAPSVFTWNAIISAHVESREYIRGFQLYQEMQANGVQPYHILHLTVLKACGAIQNIDQGRQIHDQIIIHHLETDVYLGSSIIDMYMKCMCLEDAHRVFDKQTNLSIVAWNALISGYVNAGFCYLAIELFDKMQTEGFKPACFIFPSILKACGIVKNVQLGKFLHNKIRESGFEMDLAVGNALIDMYCKCATFHEAHEVFDKMQDRNVISWTTMIVGYIQHGHSALALKINEQMLQKGIVPHRATFLAILKVCGNVGDIELGRVTHTKVLQVGLDVDVSVANTLIDMYAKCANLDEASHLFEKACNRNIVSWGAMISGYIQHGQPAYALHLFMRMQDEDIKTDVVILASLLKACGNIKAIQEGRLIHDQVLRSNLQLDIIIGNSLITMYAKCGIVTEAQVVFTSMPNHNLISWGSILATLIEEGDAVYALFLINKMQEEGIIFDQAILLSAVQACGIVGSIKKMHILHEQIKGSIFKDDLVIGNALIDVYSKIGAPLEALKVFNELPIRDEISWGTIINSQVQHGDNHAVLDIFVRLTDDNVKPNDIILSCILKACGDIRAVKKVHIIHDLLIKCQFQATNAILNALINMYANCMSLIEAQAIFDRMQSKDEVSWSTLIAGYALTRNWSMIMYCLEEMQQQGFKPTNVLFVTILGACSKAGLLEECCSFFVMMTKYFSLNPDIEHYNCMIDVLGRTGHLIDAIQFIETMPISVDLLGWTSLLTNCKVYGNVEIGRICFQQLMQLNPNNIPAFNIMMSIYMDAGLWEDINRMHEMKASMLIG